MSYLGVPPFGNTVRTSTSKTGDGVTNAFYPDGGYVVGYLDVYYNGVKLTPVTDYTADDGVVVSLATIPANGSTIEFVAYWAVSFTDTITNAGGTMQGTLVTRDVIPSANNTYDLGNTTNRFANLYLSGNTIILGNAVISANASHVNFVLSNGSPLSVNATFVDANSTVSGVLKVVDSVTNTNILVAAAANSVKTAFDLATTANSGLATAYSNAVGQAATLAGTAYSNAVSVAAADATSKAATAYSNAVTQATTLAGTAYTNAVAQATTLAGTAYSNAISVAAADATSKAATAYSNAVATAAADATSKAATAYSNAVSVAAADATSKAATAYSNAVATIQAGSTFTGPVFMQANLTANNVRLNGSMQIDGNLTVSGTSVTLNVASLSVGDNMIYLNSNSTVSNPDLGFAGNYNDGTYRHAGFFRDATDGVWKVFHQYTPEPDASAYIDTANASFALANLQANTFIGNLSGDATSVGGNTALTLRTYSDTVAATAYSNAITFAANASNLSGGTLPAARLSGAYALGNTTITGFANVSSTLQVGTNTSTFGTAMSIVANGNVGIGNTTPLYKLHVNGNSFLQGNVVIGRLSNTLQPAILEITSGGSQYDSIIDLGYYDTFDAAIWYLKRQGSDGSFRIVNAGSGAEQPVMTVRTDNAVGIGTVTPQSQFVVSNAGASGFEVNPTGGVGSGVLLQAYNRSTSAYMQQSYYALGHTFNTGSSGSVRAFDIAANGNIGVANTAPTAKFTVNQSAAATGLDVYTNDIGTSRIVDFKGFDNSLGVVSRMIVQADGKVGIGTGSPAAALHVASGNFRFTNGDGFATSNALIREINAAAGSGNQFVTSSIGFRTGAFTDEGIITFGTALNASTPTERVRIAANGSVGIGTTGPALRLDVRGGGLNLGTSTDGIRLGVLGDNSAYDNVLLAYSGYNAGAPEVNFQPRTTPGSGVLTTFFRFKNSNGSSTLSNNRASVSIDGELLVGTTSGLNSGIIHSYAAQGYQAYTAQVANNVFSLFQGFNSSGTLAAQITGGGVAYFQNNLGVANTSPAHALAVNGSAAFGSGIFTGHNLTTGDAALELGGSRTGDGAAYLDMHSTSGTDYCFRILKNAGLNGLAQIENRGTGDLRIVNSGAANITLWANNDQKVVISANGNVGIGNTTPSSKLVVSGDMVSFSNGASIAFHAGSRITSPYTSISETTSGAMSVFGHNASASRSVANQITAQNNSYHSHFIRMYYDHGIAFHTSGTQTAGNIVYDFGTPGNVVAGAGERMRIDPSGNVGIGTASPSGIFHVSQSAGSMYLDTAGGIPRMRLGGGNGFGFNRLSASEDIFFGEPGDTGTWRVRGAGTISLGVGSSATSMVIGGNGGNVGIGTTSPRVRFSIDVGSQASVFEAINIHNQSTSPGTGTTVTFSGYSTTSAYPTWRYAGIKGIYDTTSGGLNSGSWGGRLNFFVNRGGGATDYEDVMTITGGGRVGIGTASPLYRLDVAGASRVGDGVAQTDPNTTDITTNAEFLIGGTGGNYLAFGQKASNLCQWIQSCYFNPTTAVYPISLNPLGGNVGIGTISPQGRLHVSGGDVVLYSGSSGNSPKLILGGEYSSTDKSIYLESFFVTFKGHNNEGFRFITADAGGTTYERLRISGNGSIISQAPYYIGSTSVAGSVISRINVINTDMTDNSSSFDRITNDGDGGGTFWNIVKDSYVNLYSTSGGHGGQWGSSVYLQAGWWRWSGSVRLSSTNGSIHPSTDPGNYKFSIQFVFNISGGPSTGGLKWDVDTLGDKTRVSFSGAPVYMSAGLYQPLYNTNGYEGVKQVYITDLYLERVG